MEKRHFLFIFLTILVWGGFMLLQLYFAPPEKPRLAAEAKVDNKQADDKTAKEKKPDDEPEQKPSTSQPVAQNAARQRVTLGSLDPASGYTMLVTFDNRGAAIERIELNKFHDLDDLSGYLGHLALTDAAKGGAEVNIVGRGTPAELAGLQPGDVITGVNGEATPTAEEFLRYLQKNTKPEDVVPLDVQRGSGTVLTLNVTLIRRPLELIRPEDNSGARPLANQLGPFGKVGPPSYRMTLRQLGDKQLASKDDELKKIPSLFESHWDVKVDEATGKITFTLDLTKEHLDAAGIDSALQVTKSFTLPKATDDTAQAVHHLDFQVAVKNTGSQSQAVAYRLEGPNGLPLEGWWYANKVHPGWAGAGARDVAISIGGAPYLFGNPLLISHATTQGKEGNPPVKDVFPSATDERSLRYIAVDTQYFASALVTPDVFGGDNTIDDFEVDAAYALPLNTIIDKKWAKTTNASFFVDSPSHTLEPGASHEDRYVIFAGPKDANILSAYQLTPLIEYGWFGWVSRALKAVLDAIYAVFRNYGIGIILLTVVVRLCLLPLGMRQARSAAVMQQLAPEMAKLKEKYAGDMEKQAAAQRELFAKHGFNPMGGCVLMLFQLPIFIGLYRCLATDIDLREAALIPGWTWCSNLAGPDALFRWKEHVWPVIGDEAHGWLGPYFNVLPLITIALFMVQQKLFSPPAVDEEQKMQQKIMSFMTIFMGVMFYKVPAGLCIYFITSSLWGIAERKLLPKPKPRALDAISEKPDPGPKKPPGEPGFMERLMAMADAKLKEAKSVPPKKKAKR